MNGTRRFLIATHGTFADGIKSSIELILGEQSALSVLSCYLTPDFDLHEALKPHLDGMAEGDELIILTDVAGGSVNNAVMTYLDRPGVHLVTGLNFPMALAILSSDESDSAEDVIAEAVTAGREGILYCNAQAASSDDDDF